jgi:hypothetical protein
MNAAELRQAFHGARRRSHRDTDSELQRLDRELLALRTEISLLEIERDALLRDQQGESLT